MKACVQERIGPCALSFVSERVLPMKLSAALQQHHERVSFFDSAYAGTPPWDTGHPQPEMIRLARAGEILGRVVDLGCGTGENALYLAGVGHTVVGIDISPTAIGKARRKAESRGQQVEARARFVVGDTLDMQPQLGQASFDSAIDCGLFHTFSDEMRPVFARSVDAILKPGGTYFMLCFSEQEPEDWGGPRRVTQDEIRETFGGKRWRLNYIRDALFETNWARIKGRAWLSSITLLP